MSKSAMTARRFNARAPFVDWMVYVPRAVPELAAPAVVVPVAGLGNIVICQEVPPVMGDAAAQANIARVAAVLGL